VFGGFFFGVFFFFFTFLSNKFLSSCDFLFAWTFFQFNLNNIVGPIAIHTNQSLFIRLCLSRNTDTINNNLAVTQ
jgi:hypothetical protein